MCSYFRHISLYFYSNSEWESSLDVEFNSKSNNYPHYMLLMDPATPKTRNTWKMWWWCHHHIFSSISCFWGSGAHKKYVEWVLVGCRIKFRIEWALPLRIWVKQQGDMSKIRTQKVVFFSSKINKYYFIIFLRRPILDLKIPLMDPFKYFEKKKFN